MSDLDRVKQGLASFVRGVVPKVAYLGGFPALVASQNADGTLELLPDDSAIPPQSGVPIRTGIPGATVKVAGGARVLLEFIGGDPRSPVASIWESGTVTELDLATALLKLGSAGAVDALVKGTTYRTAESTYNTLMAAHLTAAAAAWAALAVLPAVAAVPATAALCVTAGATATAAATGEATFEGGAAGYLSTVAKTI